MTNRFRTLISSLLASCLLAGCYGEAEPERSREEACKLAYDDCVAVCPENLAPGATARDSCLASCSAEHSLCVVPPPAAR